MSFWSRLLDEAHNDYTFVLLGGLAVAVLVARVRAPGEPSRIRPPVILTILHLILLPIIASLRMGGRPAASSVWLAAMVFYVLGFVRVAATVLSDALLPRIGLRTPHLLSDAECYRFDKASFQDILHRLPEIAERVAGILARRRVELSAVKENLDGAARERRVVAAKHDLLGRIRHFFGLHEDTHAAARPHL